jgi:hypothetical protein
MPVSIGCPPFGRQPLVRLRVSISPAMDAFGAGESSNRRPFGAVYTASQEVTMRVSTVVLAVSCLVTAYALVGTRVHALEDSSTRRLPSGVGVGAHVVLGFSSDPKSIGCTIAQVEAGWVRCGAPDGFGPTLGPNQITDSWYDLAHVVWVQKVATER